LVVDTLSSTRAVAGEIFVAEARRKGLAGIVIDGPIRDTAHLDDCSYLSSNNEGNGTTTTTMRIYATSVTPYSGTTDSPGKTQEVVTCGGIEVRPGDIVVGDDNGIIVGEASTFSKLIPIAKKIQQIESKLIAGITSSEEKSLASMTNLEDHVRHRLEGKLSNLEFRIQKIQK
jgi:4-hydroxy-4-methyl-2-oxoglutarate aldolase